LAEVADSASHSVGTSHQVARVGAAPVGRGREVRGVRLDLEVVQRRHGQRVPQALGVLEGHRAGERQVEPAVDAGARQLGVPAEAVQDGARRRALVVQHPQHVGVRVAVVDLQRQVEPLREPDVPAERLLLHRAALGPCAEEVEPRLAHDPHPRTRGQLGDLVVRRLELAALGQPRRLVRVQCHAAEQGAVPLHQVDGEPGAGQVAADLHRARDVDLGGPVEQLGQVGAVRPAVVRPGLP
jgi:hypothetical protein